MPKSRVEEEDEDELEDEDDPFETIDSMCDSVGIITDDLGRLRALFYTAAYRSAPRLPVSLERLEGERDRLKAKGLTSPLTNQAILLLREAMGLPTLQ